MTEKTILHIDEIGNIYRLENNEKKIIYASMSIESRSFGERFVVFYHLCKAVTLVDEMLSKDKGVIEDIQKIMDEELTRLEKRRKKL